MYNQILFVIGSFILSKLVSKGVQTNIIVDLGHKSLPRIENNIYTYVILQSLSLGFPVITYIIYDFSLFWLLLMHYLRFPAYRITILPLLDNENHRKYNKVLGGFAGGTSDYIWSGHSSTVAYASMWILNYKNNIFFNISVILYNLILGFLIVCTRNHYTIDVYLGWIIGSLFGYISNSCFT